MKIKTKQKLNLSELIQHVWENEVYPCRYINNFNGEVVFNDTGKFMTDESFISPNSYFTVEVEEDLTEDATFSDLIVIFKRTSDDIKGVKWNVNESISGIKAFFEKLKDQTLLSISYVDKKGETTLVYSSGGGIPESGVLEVDDE